MHMCVCVHKCFCTRLCADTANNYIYLHNVLLFSASAGPDDMETYSGMRGRCEAVGSSQ